MSFVAVTISLPGWFIERLGNPDQAALERRVLEALVADCLRTGRAGKDEARRWLGLGDAPATMDAFLEAMVSPQTGPEAAVAHTLILPPAGPLALPDVLAVPALLMDAGEPATWRYVEFFIANIRNPHMRRAYARACQQFFAWCEHRGLALVAIRPFDVAGSVEQLQQTHAAPSVKQRLAAVHMLFDWLITGQIMPMNPAAAGRGPKHVVKTGKTPVLDGTDGAEAWATSWARLLSPLLGCKLAFAHAGFRQVRGGRSMLTMLTITTTASSNSSSRWTSHQSRVWLRCQRSSRRWPGFIQSL